MRDGRLTPKGKLIQVGIWIGLIVFCGFIWNVSYIAVESGFLPTSEGYGPKNQHSELTLHVSSSGKSVYKAASHISEELREEIMGTTYPTPDAAIAAVVGPLPGNPAHAHAVNVCWNGPGGKASHQTGSSRHWTFHRYDSGGYRYTTTQPQLLQTWGWLTTDTFKTRTRLSYC
jgi:hypothetical protein